jgi:hypothetical protein
MIIKDSPTIIAINVLRPNAQWAIIGEDLNTLQWDDKIQTRPTDDEILATIAAQQVK